jgi:glycine/serine hydroxymethyltransferase
VEEDMVKIARWMREAVDARDDGGVLGAMREEVKKFALKYPLPSDKH